MEACPPPMSPRDSGSYTVSDLEPGPIIVFELFVENAAAGPGEVQQSKNGHRHGYYAPGVSSTSTPRRSATRKSSLFWSLRRSAAQTTKLTVRYNDGSDTPVDAYGNNKGVPRHRQRATRSTKTSSRVLYTFVLYAREHRRDLGKNQEVRSPVTPSFLNPRRSSTSPPIRSTIRKSGWSWELGGGETHNAEGGLQQRLR